MDFSRILNIAGKEVRDHITSSRFIVLLFLMMTLCAVYMLRDTWVYFDEIRQYSIDSYYPLDYLPYSLSIFEGIRGAIGGSSIFGSIIAIALGFDLITKERESGSIKAILSVPIYRDELINGKALGGIIVLVVATTIVFVLAFGILLIYSIVPEIYELSYIFMFWFFTVLYLSGIFIMSLMLSTFAKSSGMSLIASLLALLILTSVIYTVGSSLPDFVLGPDPSEEYQSMEDYDPDAYYELSSDYSAKKDMIMDITDYFSLNTNYFMIAKVLTRPQDSREKSPDYFSTDAQEYDRTLPPVGEALSSMWGYILFLIAYPVVFFGIAYVKFMRLDLR
ncbi:ABC-2 type transport system permease protein [Methanomicrobium sp. W14]|uniref:ABC transporter permease n=1 Tax=Methanomicrobium sp. W14 TaxID=2817839 RepID=UPI001AE274E7|nr:ABC transporter permease subunit [Methanomicrobium sp. W14]MBP2133937.1 ABC-2 type transport system permease protein [Methanomicrobium sp. W14]